MVELDGPAVEGFTVASSKDGSRGFASLSKGGSSGASVNGEGDLVGSDASTGGSSAGFAASAFFNLAWPLRKKCCRNISIKINLNNPKERRITNYPGAVLKARNWVYEESPEERDTS